MIELKPCPFCGSKADCVYVETRRQGNEIQYRSNIYYASKPGYVRCCKCFVAVKRYSRMSSAVKAWNTRKGGEGK